MKILTYKDITWGKYYMGSTSRVNNEILITLPFDIEHEPHEILPS